MSKHEILIHADNISAMVAELKAGAEYKKYKALYLDDGCRVGKDYIKALEDVEMRLLGNR